MAFKGDLDALILGVLQHHSAHGYEIAKQITKKTNDLMRLGEGKLYPALHKLEEAGLVTAEWQQQEGKPSRRIYKITEQGLRELDHKKSVWAQLSSGIDSILSAARKEDRSHA
ncbi:MAG TPA: helix-turn-helix transcriptional regulator [Fimbriimonadaceae bacterium]|nr:helix-turn-helix transcriptional regulator [Fimbriimonadaceae bacterium]